MVRQLDDKVARLAAGLHGYRDMFSFGGLELQSMGFKGFELFTQTVQQGQVCLDSSAELV